MKKKNLFMLMALFTILVFSCQLATGAAYTEVTLNHAISFTGDALADPIDGMWQGFKEGEGGAGGVTSSNAGIIGNGTSVKFPGYQSGQTVQYAYQDTSELHNKLIKTKIKFEGEFVNANASFFTFVFRAEGYSTKLYWDSKCYTILIKAGQVEVNKYPAKIAGVNNQLGGTKGTIPIVKSLATPFAAGTYDIEMGALDGKSPKTNADSVNLILKINGKEIVNVWDDTGRTPVYKQKGYFMVSLTYTQADLSDDDAPSRSSLTILQTAVTPSSSASSSVKNSSVASSSVKSSSAASSSAKNSSAVSSNAANSQATSLVTTSDSAISSSGTDSAESGSELISEPESSSDVGSQVSDTSSIAVSSNGDNGKPSSPLLWIGIIIAAVVVIGGGIYMFVIRK